MSEFDLDVRVTTTSDAEKNPQHISLCLTCPIVSCFYC